MKKINPDKIIEFFYNQNPRISWEYGETILDELMGLQDSNGQNLYRKRTEPPLKRSFHDSTLLGYPAYQIPEKTGLTLKFTFRDGSTKEIDFDIDGDKK